jgi:oxygen-independent coproporphyrinogen-3 oxidase
MLEDLLRTGIRRLVTKEKDLALEDRIPSLEELSKKFENIENFGIYLHIPFCEQICPYCPYNKEIYTAEKAEAYTKAVVKEIDFYSKVAGDTPVTSFYIGGGTPTTMLQTGLLDIVEHIFHALNIECDVHTESHVNHMTGENLKLIEALGVKHLSIGVEALQDKHLNTLGRPYTAEKAKAAVELAVNNGFECFNADLMFALPDQSISEIVQAAQTLIDMGVDQVATYPLFRFPYTKMGAESDESNYHISTIFKRRKILASLENIFYDNGFVRSSTWAFTRSGTERYCSVTVPLYVGLGASGGSYLKDIFYLNTFNVSEYINAMENEKPPIALSVDLSEQTQMAGWFYWRIYETEFRRSDFKDRFGKELDKVYGKFLKPLPLIGFSKDVGNKIKLTGRGAYWLHALEDIFSIDYVGKLWGTSKQNPWPKKVTL